MAESINIIVPDYISLVTQQIAIGLSETRTIFSTASSFFYEHKNRLFLITNWHNVTGRNPNNGTPISGNHCGIPDVFFTYLRLKEGTGSAEFNTIKLYTDDNMLTPNWLIHPEHQEKVDVVALEIDKQDMYMYPTINQSKFQDDIPPEIGDECFVIGYPFDEFRYLGLPIWKKASIATEPTVNEDQLPKLLIDTATRSGLSGSPVVYQRIGVHRLGPGGEPTMSSITGRIRGFLGVYSGRIGKGEIHAQLGIVWKEKVIQEIIEGNLKGNIDFQRTCN